MSIDSLEFAERKDVKEFAKFFGEFLRKEKVE
jgi:hypothetical protein